MGEPAIDYNKLKWELHNMILKYKKFPNLLKLKEQIDREIESLRGFVDIREEIAMFDKICAEEAEKEWWP